MAKKMTKNSLIKDLTRQIKNSRRRLKRLEHQHTWCPEAREAFENAPLAENAVRFMAYLSSLINEERELISIFENKRERLLA